MKYLARVIAGSDSFSRSFDTLGAAESWLDENNNNMELTTIIDTYTDDWQKIDGFFYTKGKE